MESIPFYWNWTFWSMVVAFMAIVLSQLPPIKSWFKKAKLDLDVYENISVAHKVGNPNLTLHVIISNIGGRRVRVKNINVSLEKNGGQLITLPAKSYLQDQSDDKQMLFTGFSLLPNEEWGEIIRCYRTFNRNEEETLDRIIREMKEDYYTQTSDLVEPYPLIIHNNSLTRRAIDFFNSKFVWEVGEYIMSINVETMDKVADISKKFRFTIYESQRDDLREVTNKYEIGADLWCLTNGENTKHISLPISED